MHFPSEKVRHYFTDPNYIVEDSKQVRKRRNRNQRREIIKDGWADYEGEVVRSEDIQFKQNYPEETVAPSQVWKEKMTIHVGSYPFPFNYFKIVYLVNQVYTILKRK